MITIEKINKSIVSVPDSFNSDRKKPALGYKLFPEPYSNIFLSAKKNSGKTWTIFHILKKCMGKDTKLVIFCSTVYNDDAYRYITKYFEKKGHEVEKYTAIHEPDPENPKRKMNILAEIVKQLEEQAEEDENDDDESEDEDVIKENDIMMYIMNERRNVDDDEKEEKKKKKESKYLVPKIIFVFDDFSTELKDPSVTKLIKENRHFKSKTIISSQYLLDLDISARKNIDYFLVFKNQLDKIKYLYQNAGINSISYEQLEAMYKEAVSKPYSFFYVDTRQEKFRQNFDKQFNVRDKK